AAQSRNLPSAQPVVAEFRKDGFEPKGYTLSTYAAIQLWAEAVAKAGTTDAAKVATTIHSQCWETIIGKLCCDPKGDLTGYYDIWIFRDGTMEDTAGAASSASSASSTYIPESGPPSSGP